MPNVPHASSQCQRCSQLDRIPQSSGVRDAGAGPRSGKLCSLRYLVTYESPINHKMGSDIGIRPSGAITGLLPVIISRSFNVKMKNFVNISPCAPQQRGRRGRGGRDVGASGEVAYDMSPSGAANHPGGLSHIAAGADSYKTFV